jgi:hypothetical protein
MKKPTLIPEWKQAWKFFSVQVGIIFAIAAGLYAELPALREYLSPETFARLSGILAFVAIVARIIKQQR